MTKHINIDTPSNSELEKEVREIAEYLGCNADELWSEIAKLINKQIIEARIEELELQWADFCEIDKDTDYADYIKKRLTQLRTTK